MLSALANSSELQIANDVALTSNEQNKALQQLSSGRRIDSGADDAAGLSISDGLSGNIAALDQSSLNLTDGVSMLQTADNGLSQITSLLTRGVSLATEAANGAVSNVQRSATDSEFQSLLAEINNISADTSYNGQDLFQPAYGVSDRTLDNGSIFDKGATIYGNAQPLVSSSTLFTSDGTISGSSVFVYAPLSVDARALGLTADHSQTCGGAPLNFAANLTLLTAPQAQSTLKSLTAAINQVSASRGIIGAMVEQLQAASSVATTESQNLDSAYNSITSADIGSAISEDTRMSVLQQTGIAALQQSKVQQQNIVKLLQ